MPVRAEVVLSDEERKVLERWARRPKSAQALAFRCRVVLAAAEGRSSTEIAAELGCNASTVGRWRGRFAQRGIDGLHDEPRPGKPRSITDADVERVIVKTLEQHEGCDALVDPVDGGRDGDEPVGGQPHLAGVRVEAAPDGDVQALPGSAVHRQGARHRRPLSQSARGRGRALRLGPRSSAASSA